MAWVSALGVANLIILICAIALMIAGYFLMIRGNPIIENEWFD